MLEPFKIAVVSMEIQFESNQQCIIPAVEPRMKEDPVQLIEDPPLLGLPQLRKYKRKFELIDKFIDNSQLSIGFFVGPSGCGKIFLLKSYLHSRGIKCHVYANLSEVLQEQSSLKAIYSHLLSSQGIATILIRSFIKPSFKACAEFYEHMRAFRGKLIFVLNSQEVSPKVLKSFTKVQIKRETHSLDNAEIIEFPPYTKTDIKHIVQEFKARTKTKISCDKATMDDMYDLYDGDSRRILHQLYFKYSLKAHPSTKERTHSRVSMFHMLGKLLYNKRAVVAGMDHKETKKSGQVSYREMTVEELSKFDPPFYFNPLELVRQSNLSFDVILGFIIENFPSFYNSLEDLRDVNLLLARMIQMRKGQFKAKWKSEQAVDSLHTLILTYGVMVHNLHGSEVKKEFRPFRAPTLWKINRELSIKQDLLKKNLPQLPLNDILLLSSYSKYLPENKFQLMKPINLILKNNFTSQMDRELGKNDLALEKDREIPINRNYRYQPTNQDQGEYDEISESD